MPRTTPPKEKAQSPQARRDESPVLELDQDGRRLVVLSLIIEPQLAWNDGRGEFDSITNVDMPRCSPLVLKPSDVGPVVMAKLRETLPSLEAQARAAEARGTDEDD